jgi:hypothetical protein
VQEIQLAIEGLPRDQVRKIQTWLEEKLEDDLEFTDGFKASIECGKRDLAESRVRHKNPSLN